MDYKFYKINERLAVTVNHGEISVDVKEKASRGDKKKCRINGFDLLPKLAKDYVDDLRIVTAIKAFGHISSVVRKYLPRAMPMCNLTVSYLGSINFEFTFSAWFCEAEGNDKIVSYSIHSVLDWYSKAEGKSTALKRLKIGLDIMQNGKKGKVYDLEDVEEGTEDTHGRGIKGVITDEGINKIKVI